MVDLEDDDDIDGAVIDETEVDEADDEEPAPKAKKAPKTDDDDGEEAPAPKKKVAVGTKSKGKEKTNVKTTGKSKKAVKKAPKPVAARASRTGDAPFLATSGIGRAFNLALKGIKVSKLKQFITDNDLQPWVLSFIRKGATLNGRWAWDVEEDNGRITVSRVRKVSAKPAKKAA